MAKPIIGLVPPNGWHYIDGDVRLSGYSYNNLLRNVENYRAENNFQQGDVEGDVNSFICTNWPNFCHGVDMVSITSINQPTQATDLLADIQTWAKNILHSAKPHPLVTEEIAESRAIVCRACPQNINWRAGCSSCIAAADRLCASIRQGKDTKSSNVLGGCRTMRHDNRTAIFFDKDQIHKSQHIPTNCWINK